MQFRYGRGVVMVKKRILLSPPMIWKGAQKPASKRPQKKTKVRSNAAIKAWAARKGRG